jgi:acyl carrier protein
MEDQNKERVRTVFSSALGIEKDKIGDEYMYGDKKWDSVSHMALVAGLETEFNIMIDTTDVIAMSSVKIAREILTKYGVQFDS